MAVPPFGADGVCSVCLCLVLCKFRFGSAASRGGPSSGGFLSLSGVCGTFRAVLDLVSARSGGFLFRFIRLHCFERNRPSAFRLSSSALLYHITELLSRGNFDKSKLFVLCSEPPCFQRRTAFPQSSLPPLKGVLGVSPARVPVMEGFGAAIRSPLRGNGRRGGVLSFEFPVLRGRGRGGSFEF